MFVKFATSEIISSSGNMARTAHRADFSHVKPRDGYIYVRSRAISSRTNDNWDTFPAAEIKKAWRTFIGKPVFVNHHNDDPKRARGVIVDAALHEDVSPFGEPDTWVEVLMEVDAVRFPKLAAMVLSGDIDKTSMGCSVERSRCSFCGNEAESPIDFCKHVKSMKGRRINRTTASGVKEAVLVSEICLGISFFENSLLVETPADATAMAFLDPDKEEHHRKIMEMASGNVSPRLATSNTSDDGRGNTELSTDAGEGDLSRSRPTDRVPVLADHQGSLLDLGDDVFGERGVGVSRPPETSTSLDHVSRVVSREPKQPVRRVVADRVVASVSDNLTFGDGSDQRFVPPSVGSDARSSGVIEGEPSVAVGEHPSGPRPTLVESSGIDLGEVPVHDRLSTNEPARRGVNALAHGQQDTPRYARTASQDWSDNLMTNHHALDEQIAPPKVDTLRDSVCSVCGSPDSIVDGVCQTCGFEEPTMFAEPDTLSPQIEDLRDDGKPAFLQCTECHEKFPTMPPERREKAEEQSEDDEEDLDKTSVLVGYDAQGSAVNEDATCPVCEEGTLVPGSDEPEPTEDPEGSDDSDEPDDEVEGDDEEQDEDDKEKVVSARRTASSDDQRYELYVGDDGMPVAYFASPGEAFDAAKEAGESDFSVIDSHTGDAMKEGGTTASLRTAIQNCGCPDEYHLADCPLVTGDSGLSEADIWAQEERRLNSDTDWYEGHKAARATTTMHDQLASKEEAMMPKDRTAHRRMADYNGWPNRETWSAFSWLANDYGIYQSVVQARSAEELKGLYESIPGRDKVDESQIDWQAVYEGFSDDRTASRRSAHRRTAALSWRPAASFPGVPAEGSAATSTEGYNYLLTPAAYGMGGTGSWELRRMDPGGMGDWVLLVSGQAGASESQCRQIAEQDAANPRTASRRTAGFWEEIEAQLAQIRRARTVDDVIAALGGSEAASVGDAFFGGSGGDETLFGALIDAGWRVRSIESDYYFVATSPGGEALTYIEGDVYRGNRTSSRRQAHRRTAVSLSNIGKTDDPLVFTGKDPSGKQVKFKVTEQESKDLREVMFSDLAMNFSGVDVDESEIIKDAFRRSAALSWSGEGNYLTATDEKGLKYKVWRNSDDHPHQSGKWAYKVTGIVDGRPVDSMNDENESKEAAQAAAEEVGAAQHSRTASSRRTASATLMSIYADGFGNWHAQVIGGTEAEAQEEARRAIIEELSEREGPNFSPDSINVVLDAEKSRGESRVFKEASGKTASFSRGPAPAWLNERNNDGYGTPNNHEFWSTVDFEDVNGWRIFNKDGLWYGYKLSQNAWSNGATDKADIVAMADPSRQIDVWASRKTGISVREEYDEQGSLTLWDGAYSSDYVGEAIPFDRPDGRGYTISIPSFPDTDVFTPFRADGTYQKVDKDISSAVERMRRGASRTATASRKTTTKESKMDAQKRRRMEAAIAIQARRGQKQQERIAALEGVLREVISATGVRTPKAASLVLASEDENGDGKVAETDQQALPESTDVESEGKVKEPPAPKTTDDPQTEGGTDPDDGFNKPDDPESVGSGDGVTNESDSERTFTSMRLARLRIEAGVETGDDLTLGQTIANSNVSMESIRNEVETLTKVMANRTASTNEVPTARPLPTRSPSQIASLASLVAASNSGGSVSNGGSRGTNGSLIGDSLV